MGSPSSQPVVHLLSGDSAGLPKVSCLVTELLQGQWPGAPYLLAAFRDNGLEAALCSSSGLLRLCACNMPGTLHAKVLVIGSALSILTGTLQEIRQVNNERSRTSESSANCY